MITERNFLGVIAGFLLLFLAVFRFPSDSMRLSFILLAEISTFCLFAAMLWNTNKWVSMFLILTCFSSLFPQYDKASFLASHHVFFCVAWFYAVTKIKDHSPLTTAIIIIGGLNVVALVFQTFDAMPFFAAREKAGDICAGLMANPNEASALLAFCIPAIFMKKWINEFKIVLTIIFLVGIVLTSSFGGLLAVLAGFAYYFSKNVNKYIAAGCFLAILSAFIFIDMGSVDIRVETWLRGLALCKQHLLFGAGLGHWKYVFVQYITNNAYMATAHNEYIQALFEMGIFVVPIVLGFIYNLYYKTKKNRVLAMAAIIILVNSIVNFPFHIATTAYIAITWFAIIEKEVCNETKREIN